MWNKRRHTHTCNEEEEEVELDENIENTNKERNEEEAEEKTQIFIKKSLQILDFMEKEVQKLRKNACQKDIKEKFLLYWNKIENEKWEKWESRPNRFC